MSNISGFAAVTIYIVATLGMGAYTASKGTNWLWYTTMLLVLTRGQVTFIMNRLAT